MLKRIIVVLVLFGTAVGAQDPGSLSDEFYASIRANDVARLQTLVKSDGHANVPDPRGGATPLMYAAAVGSLDAMRVLLDNGADVNATNSAGATALMWAVTDADKVRLLLDRGANAKVASQRGRHALLLAARADGSAAIVRMLMAAGADPHAVDAFKTTTLHAATLGNDLATIRLMVDAGLDVNAADFAGFTPLTHAAANTNLEAVKLLLAKGANVNARSGDGSFQKVKAGAIALGHFTPLSAAAAFGTPDLIKTLLDAGANVNVADVRGMTPLMLAAATARPNPQVIRMLIAAGADVNAKSLAGETALDWARKIAFPPAIDVLVRAGAEGTPHDPVAVPPASPAELRASIERSASLLRKASVIASANGGCASCHSHNVVDTLEHAAAKKGLTVDAKLRAQRQTLTKAPYFSPANLLERLDPPGSPITTVFALAALADSGYQPDRTTDIAAVHLASQQSGDGRWTMSVVSRPPIGEGPIAVTTYAIRALNAYAPPGRKVDTDARLARAGAWLRAQQAVTTEDRNMQLLGLLWAGEPAPARARLARVILDRQRPDGGWAQSDNLQSDAYATGVSLVALAEAGGIDASHAAYKKGVQYLLSTQRADGSWYVRSRAPKFQPFFDGGFPYGHDQWISSMATGWAATALALALP